MDPRNGELPPLVERRSRHPALGVPLQGFLRVMDHTIPRPETRPMERRTQTLDIGRVHPRGHNTIQSSASDSDRTSEIPDTAPYIKRCLQEFIALAITQNLDILDHTIQAEPLWHNHRFHIPLSSRRVGIWLQTYEAYHISDLLDRHTSQPHNTNQWDHYLFNMHHPRHSRTPTTTDGNAVASGRSTPWNTTLAPVGRIIFDFEALG